MTPDTIRKIQQRAGINNSPEIAAAGSMTQHEMMQFARGFFHPSEAAIRALGRRLFFPTRR